MGSSTKRLRYLYDSRGNRKALIDQDGGRFTYAYDAVNRITQLINPQGDRTSYAYDAAGRRTVKKLANGTRASFTYDNASNLTTLANLKSDNTVISSFDYAYDKMGNRTSVVEADGSRVTWTYDDTYQLTGEHRTGSNAYEDSYSYDAAGNRLLKIHDGARTTYSYDAANQLENSEDASGRTTYTFDADGNQERVVEANGDRTTTSWDYENRTTLLQLASGIRNTMAYEPDGLRVKLEESTGTKKFVWDDQNYLAVSDEDDNIHAVYTNEPMHYGTLVSEYAAGSTHWHIFDATGSTRGISDSAGVLTDSRLYDAFGNTIAESGSTPLSLLFGGEFGYFTDATTAQIYIRKRIALPPTGRWTAIDPLYYLLPQRPYVFAGNQPITKIDPSGLQPWYCCCFRGSGQSLGSAPSGQRRIFCDKQGELPGLTGGDAACRYLSNWRYGGANVVEIQYLRCQYDQCPRGTTPAEFPAGTGREITVHVTSATLGDIPCGTFAGVKWRFDLPDAAENCHGYVVQKVDIYCDIDRSCAFCPPMTADLTNPDDTPKAPSYSFYEAFEVPANSRTPRMQPGQDSNDQAGGGGPSVAGTCGNFVAVGTLKFFCSSVTGDFGGLNRPTPPAGPACGQNWAIRQVFRPVFSDRLCATQVGPIPATQEYPLWWPKRPEADASRMFWYGWNCCANCPNPGGKADAKPR